MIMAPEPRLRFRLLSEGAVWYHQASSRNHVLIDPRAEARSLAPGFVRPIELWRAPRWQRPPSAAVVRYSEADLPDSHAGLDSDEPPAVGDVVNRQSVIDFVGDVSAFRLGTLGALIDAVAAALAGGPPVVLAAATAEAGALWIGAVSFFAPPATCLEVSFSTHERLDDVLSQLDRETAGRQSAEPGQSDENRDGRDGSRDGGRDGRDGRDGVPEPGWRTPVLSVVPQADIDRLSRRDDLPVVVVDPRVEATLVAVGGVDHRQTNLGQKIKVTDWSRLALDACCEDYLVLERCLRRLDEVSLASPAPGGQRGEWWPVEVSGQTRLQQAAGPAWPLAAAVALSGDLPLALPTATRVILRDTPSSVRLSSELAGALTSLVAATVNDAEQAWTRLQAALVAVPVRGALIQAAFESYLRLSLADDSWLLRQAPPLPMSVPFDPGLPGRLRASIARMIERLSSDPGHDVRRGVLLLRAIDFADRMSRLVNGPNLAALGLGRLTLQAVRSLLDPELGSRIAEIAGPLDGVALARWIVPPMTREHAGWPDVGNPVGERLPAPVIALLAGAIDAGGLVAVARPEALAAEPVALEVAVASASGRIAGDQRLRGPAVEYLLHAVARTYPDADPAAMVAEVFDLLVDGEPWNAAVMLHVVERAPAALGPDLVPFALRQLPDWIDDELSGRLAASLLKRVQFLPRRGADGQLRPRRAGTTDQQAQLLNLLAATGEGWLQLDDGLHRRAAEILMWADRAWPALDQQIRRLIAPRITVAAFQVALAAEPAQSLTVLRSRLAVVPLGSTWRAAVPLGVEPAMPMIAQVLRLNRYRLAGELVLASTRAMLNPPQDLGELPRLPMLPIGPVLRWLVSHENTPGLKEHLAALVDQELREHQGPIDRAGLLAFWERALPGASLAVAEEALQQLRGPALGGVLDVALGIDRPTRGAGLASLLAAPSRRELGVRGRRATSSELDVVSGRPAGAAGDPFGAGPSGDPDRAGEHGDPAANGAGAPGAHRVARRKRRWWRRWGAG
jgi:hypothetical protein